MTKLETFSEILTLVGTLSRSYIEELITIIQNEDYANANTIFQYVEKEKSTEDIVCPCCHSKHIVRKRAPQKHPLQSKVKQGYISEIITHMILRKACILVQ